MRSVERGALGGLSPATRDLRRGSGSDAANRRALSGEALLRLAQDDVRPQRGRARGQSQAAATAEAPPRRAVGEHEAQLPWSRLSQSISSLALLAFTSLLATMRRSDFCVGVVPSSLPPSGLPLMADPRRPPWVMTLNVPTLPPPIPLRPRMDFGRRVRRHADPAGPACSRVHLRSVLRYASGFFPTRPHGASPGVSRRQGLRAVASGSRLLPPRPAKDFHLQSSAHARHTLGLATPSLRSDSGGAFSSRLSRCLAPGGFDPARGVNIGRERGSRLDAI